MPFTTTFITSAWAIRSIITIYNNMYYFHYVLPRRTRFLIDKRVYAIYTKCIIISYVYVCAYSPNVATAGITYNVRNDRN